jgi:hypothetical protein
MKRIFHPGGSVITGSDLADAVLVYAEALSHRRQVDVVDIPVVGEDGLPGRAQFLVGAASQLVSVTAEPGSSELIEPATADLLHRKARNHTPLTTAWLSDELESPQFDEFDY